MPIKKIYTRSQEEVESLLREGWKIVSISYFVYGDGPALFILEK